MSFPRQPQAGVAVEYMQFCRVEADRDLGTDRAPAVRPDLHIDQVVTDGDAEKDAVAEQFRGVATISGLQSGN